MQESSAKAIADLDLGENLEFLGAQFVISDRQNEITTYENLYTKLVADEPEPIKNLSYILQLPLHLLKIVLIYHFHSQV